MGPVDRVRSPDPFAARAGRGRTEERFAPRGQDVRAGGAPESDVAPRQRTARKPKAEWTRRGERGTRSRRFV